MKMSRIREARDYLRAEFHNEYPFALYRFQTDGSSLLLSYDQVSGESSNGTLMSANAKGQLGWSEIIRTRLAEFNYEGDLALQWRVAGPQSPIIIDPRIAFGAPALNGVPTANFKERWLAGEQPNDTAEDFGVSSQDVICALEFERIDPQRPRAPLWRT